MSATLLTLEEVEAELALPPLVFQRWIADPEILETTRDETGEVRVSRAALDDFKDRRERARALVARAYAHHAAERGRPA